MPRASREADVIKALSHPVRRQVMTLLGDGIASPKELAATLGEPLPNVSYHVGILRDLGLIKVVRETPRRGAVERHYKAVARSVTVREVIDWLLAADQARPKGWEGRVVELDEPGRRAIDGARAKFWAEVGRIEEKSARRSGEGPDGDSTRTAVAVLLSRLA